MHTLCEEKMITDCVAMCRIPGNLDKPQGVLAIQAGSVQNEIF